MVKRMLIDSTHPEETRVVVVNGTRLEELDVETSTKRQIKGNIYLAKVVRVEPSLQAAFVDYGGNRHGFLAFSEIHPDYFQIPVADRQALLAAQRAEVMRDNGHDADHDGEAELEAAAPAEPIAESDNGDEQANDAEGGSANDAEGGSASDAEGGSASDAASDAEGGENRVEQVAKPSHVETVGGDDASEQEMERRRARLLRNYKIQEVIKRRQILLVQVVKEERGNKGAALTTYLSLAGRYCVLMPNTARGGGVSRKIINATDRRRLKAIATELDCPDGMAVIVRTAGSERSKAEIKRDYEYLLRAWDQVRELTLKSTAPAGVYEEASLIKRSIRDLYARDIDEVLVDGDEGYRLAKDYMRMLTPSHAKKVQPYKGDMPLFQRFQVESQLDAMHSPIVQLKSGGYIVISQTEALVAIDVNSGRATKERHIEETAVKTNLEAADEVARQLRLRDLAGLIVIDFIDMEENRNNHAVERRVKEALKHDRARIQVGKISAFGLLELSRQRLRPSLQETSFSPCPHCAGTGLVRSVESAAMHVLRAIEEEGIRRRSSEVTVYVPSQIALYILNQKRDALAAIEERYQFRVFLLGDDELIAPNLRMERVKAENRPDDGRPAAISMDANIPLQAPAEDEEDGEEEGEEVPAAGTGETASEAEAEIEAGADEAEPKGEGEGDNGEPRRKRRRRKRKRKAGDQPQTDLAANGAEDGAEAAEGDDDEGEDGDDAAEGRDHEDGDIEGESEADRRKRRRGRRGGRRRRRNRDGELPVAAEPAPVPSSLPAVPGGELISNPDAVADVFERAERAAEAAAAAAEARVAAVTAPGADKVVEPIASDSAASEDKPKRRRAPARKKAETAEATAPVVVAAEAEIVAGNAEAETVAEDKPKRRSRKAAAETAEPEAEPKPKAKAKAKKEPKAPTSVKAKAEPAADKPKATRTRKPKVVAAAEPGAAPAEAAPAPVAKPEPVAKPAPAAETEDAPAPARPTRKGWWNKLLS